MELKRYQERLLKETRAFLDRLADQQQVGAKHAAMDAWTEATRRELGYRERKNGLGKDLPAFCIKVPTGGGKTLLATQILGQIYSTILRERNGAGLALWIVPTDQIYRDTLKALRDRRHFYRESLEHAVGRRLEIWEKQEIARLTPTRLADGLNILMFKLPSANRETQDQLRMFKDSGGNIVLHFPPEDDAEAHSALKARVPNLDMISEDLCKTSLGNLIRLCEPPVILDEGHKAYSELAQKTLEGFNASIVVELSATPPLEANVLTRVSGQELLDEEMIKLPINVLTSGEANWKDVLAKAKDRRGILVRRAERHFRETGRLIRPIVLVQVERTGRDQLDPKFVHSDFVRSHLIERLGVPESEIRVKTAEDDGLEGVDLLEEGCTVNWIITKFALQEGWDCPFAYVLVSLNNTQSELSMTQLVGRVLRQPFTKKTGIEELDQSYVFCLRKKARTIMEEVKRALEQEGYEGDEASIVDRTGDAESEEPEQRTLFRREFRRLYKDFQGKIYLPRFCVKGSEGFEGLDYFSHLLSAVNVARFDYASIEWNLDDEMKKAGDVFFRVTLGQRDVRVVGQRAQDEWESDDRVRAWLVANLPYDHFSYKELGEVVDRATARLGRQRARLGLIKFILREKLAAFIDAQTDIQTEQAFRKLYRSKRLCFYLKCVECRFEMPPEITLRRTRKLVHEDNSPVERSLFDTVTEASFNEYERKVALFIDRHPEVLWWYRNEVGKDSFAIQGYLRNKIYPDFVVQKGHRNPSPEVLVVETKGEHLAGSADTEYKREVADYFDKIGKGVTWQHLGEGFENATFRFQILDQNGDNGWKDALRRLLGDR